MNTPAIYDYLVPYLTEDFLIKSVEIDLPNWTINFNNTTNINDNSTTVNNISCPNFCNKDLLDLKRLISEDKNVEALNLFSTLKKL